MTDPCGAPRHPNSVTTVYCIRNEGHTGDHGYAGVFWPNSNGDTARKAALLDDLISALAEAWWAFDDGGTWFQIDGDGNLSPENAATLQTLVRKAQRAAGIEVRPRD